ncbi:MAG: T9SS type A sorting domain-containing protein [Flavobacteriales bacterium]|nr:T9SS type A sorting domain-containing protein [Flavobacteriales bacterium]
MFRLLTAVLGISLFLNAFGQYRMLPESNCTWHVKSTQVDNGKAFESDYNFSITGDSLINGNRYIVVNNNIFYRQVHDSGRVYVMFNDQADQPRYPGYDTMQEMLLFDFSLKLNDYFLGFNHVTTWDSIDPAELIEIDTVQIDSVSLKRFLFWCTESGIEFWWIEGIGSTAGPFNPRFTFEHYWQLCSMKSDELTYQRTGCYYTSALPFDDPNLSIYPNPANPGARIYLNRNFESVRIRLINSVGEITWLIPDFSGSTILLPNLVPGLYHLELFNDSGTTIQKLFVE